jgi:hypothetical protein
MRMGNAQGWVSKTGREKRVLGLILSLYKGKRFTTTVGLSVSVVLRGLETKFLDAETSSPSSRFGMGTIRVCVCRFPSSIIEPWNSEAGDFRS